MASMNGPFFIEDRTPGDDVLHGGEQKLLKGRAWAPPGANRRVAWEDEDDAKAPPVPIAAVKKLRKLRHAKRERAVSAEECSARLRDYFVAEAARRAPGTWAQLPSEQKAKRRKKNNAKRQQEYVERDNDSSNSNSSTSGDDDGDEEERDFEPVENSDSRRFDDEGDRVRVQDDVQKLLASTSRILSAKHEQNRGARSLMPGTIDIRRVVNVNREDPNESVIRCVEFHPSGQLVLNAGMDKALRLFHVDGKSNPKVQGIHLQDMPIHSAHFINSGDAIVMTGRRRFFYRFDLGSGALAKINTLQGSGQVEASLERCIASTDGTRLAVLGSKGRVLVVCAKSLHQTGVVRLDTTCESAVFSTENDHHLYTAGRGGTVCLWDVRQHACLDRNVDEGALHCTALASSPSHYAVGSDAGVVNLYKNSALAENQSNAFTPSRIPKPEHAFLNLSTKISSMTFNCDGRLLAIASANLKNAVRLIHVPSMTVYKNWPTQATNLRRIFAMAFSPRGEYLALGNDKGKVLLFCIRNGYPI